jgi:hypothetical protein
MSLTGEQRSDICDFFDMNADMGVDELRKATADHFKVTEADIEIVLGEWVQDSNLQDRMHRT